MAEFKVTHKAHNVNSKRILRNLVDVVEEVSCEFVIQRTQSQVKSYDFTQLVDYLDSYFDELCEDKVINRFDVIGDFRNNTHLQVQQGKIAIDIAFQQFNCLNTTKVAFLLTKI